MEKNKSKILCLILVFFISFIAFSPEIFALSCDEGTCYCNADGSDCSLLEKSNSTYNVPYSKDYCGCRKSNVEEVGTVNYSVCNDQRVLNVFRIVGYIITAAKIIAPLLLIIFGIIELGKAVIANDDKAIAHATNLLIKKAVAGVVIFFIPAIVDFVYSVVNDAKPIEETFMKCQKCLVDPLGDVCTEGMEYYE